MNPSHPIAFTLVILALVCLIYILPMLVAITRKCKAFNGIAVINVFLGWTFIGWVAALAWAASGEKAAPPAIPAA